MKGRTRSSSLRRAADPGPVTGAPLPADHRPHLARRVPRRPGKGTPPRVPPRVARMRRWAAAAAVATGCTLVAGGAAHAATPPLPMRDGVPTLAPLLGKVTPAVVNISVATTAPQCHNPLFRDPFFRRFFDLPEDAPAYGRIEGVIAAEVEPGSPAAHNGIRAGDVIVAVNRRRVRNSEEQEAAFERAGHVLALNVIRGNGQLFIVIR